MYYLFEESDSLNRPIEAFLFEAAREVFPVKAHWHYFAEIIFMLEGCAEVHCGNEVCLLTSGDMYFFHPKAVHSIYAGSGEPLKYMVLKFDLNKLFLTPNYVPKLRSIFKSAERKGMKLLFQDEETEQMDCKKIFSDCITEITEQNYGYDLLLQTLIYNLLMKIVRRWQEEGFTIGDEAFSYDNEYAIDSITEYIDMHLKENLKVSEIARQCGMSYSYFAKSFQSAYNMSCKEYIEQMRIYMVEEFLLFTDFDLNYISQETGFCDCSHMIKSFKQYKGLTPVQFRKEKVQ